LGNSVVVYDRWDGHYKAAAPGEFFVDQGRSVTFITPLEYVGANMEAQNLLPLHIRLFQKGARLMSFTDLDEIRDNRVITRNVYSGEKAEISGIDSVIICYQNRANESLYFELKGKIKELHRIGDCLAPRRVISAILEGHEIGMRI